MKRFQNTLLILIGVFGAISKASEDPELVVLMTDAGSSDRMGHIYKLNIHSWDLHILYDVPDIRGPYAIDYDFQNKQIYWTDIITKNIRRAGLDGSNATLVATLSSTSSPEGLAIDADSRVLFYTDLGNSLIGKINMDTLESTNIVHTTDIGQPTGITVDTRHKRIYWVDKSDSPRIESCDYFGQNRHVLVNTQLELPSGITIDEYAGRVFWTDRNGSVNAIDTDGTDRMRLGGAPGRQYVDLSVFNGFVYFTRYNTSSIFAVTEDGKHLYYITSVDLVHIAGLHVFSPNFKIAGSLHACYKLRDPVCFCGIIEKKYACCVHYLGTGPPCPNGFHGYHCKTCGHCTRPSICEKTTGICIGGCEPGYKARMCTEECDEGKFGKHCSMTCAHCKSGTVCDHETGACPDGCQDGWTGHNCTTACPRFTYGSPCMPCGRCAGDDPCTNTGKCPHGCRSGWKGENCDTECPQNTYSSCIPCGNCLKQPCDVMTGQCNSGCKEGWAGPKCEIEVKPPERHGLNTPTAVGVGVGVGILILVIIVLVLILVFRRRKHTEEPYVNFDKGKSDLSLGSGDVFVLGKRL